MVSRGIVVWVLVVMGASPGQGRAHSARRLADTTDIPSAGAPRAVNDMQDDKRASKRLAHDAVVALTGARGFACSGVLIHRRAVLTARHCLGVTRAVFGADVNELRAVRNVVTAVGVPNTVLDLALLTLELDAPADAYNIVETDVVPRQVRVVGFGCQDSECRGGSGRRTYFDARLRAGDWGCSHVDAARSGCAPGFELTLSRAQGADTCTGDSGGALLERRGAQWVVVGITSRSVADSVLKCGDGGIYVRVSLYRDWINKELAKL